MTRAICSSVGACLLILFVGGAAAAGPVVFGFPVGAENTPQGQFLAAGFGDGPPTGSHHGRRNRSSGDASKPVEPSHADLNGATRESADKAYRKQYGF